MAVAERISDRPPLASKLRRRAKDRGERALRDVHALELEGGPGCARSTCDEPVNERFDVDHGRSLLQRPRATTCRLGSPWTRRFEIVGRALQSLLVEAR